MQKRFMENDFRTTVQYLNTGSRPDVTYDSDIEIKKMLNYFEYMALFEFDGAIKLKYVKEMHGHLLNTLKTHDESKKIIEEWSKKDSYYFSNLTKLFAKIK